MKTTAKFAALIAAGVLVSGCAAGTAEAEGEGEETSVPTETVRLVVASAPGPITPFVWAGIREGIFAENGVDLEVQTVDGAAAMVAAVISGQADVGLSGPESGIIARANDDQPLLSIMQTAYSGVFGWGFLGGSDIQSPEDIEPGTRVGVVFPTGLSVISLQLEMDELGIPYENAEIIPVGAGPSMITAIENDEIDVLWNADVGFALLDYSDVPVEVEYPAWDDEWAGQVLMSNDQTAEDKAELLTRLNTAMGEAIQFCVDEPQACVTALAEEAPEAVTDPNLALAIWEARSAIHVAPEGETFGLNLEPAWQNTVDALVAGGLIEGDQDVTSFYTNELIAQ